MDVLDLQHRVLDVRGKDREVFGVECDEAKQFVVRHCVARASVADVVGRRSGKGKRSRKAA